MKTIVESIFAREKISGIGIVVFTTFHHGFIELANITTSRKSSIAGTVKQNTNDAVVNFPQLALGTDHINHFQA